MLFPQAYHITWGTYLARPPGSSKPHVDHDQNKFGAPLAPTDPDWEAWSHENARYDPVKLTIEQRKLVEASIREVASRYGWLIHAIAPQSDHVHVVIGAPREGEKLRDALKAVAAKAQNKSCERREWWAEGGSAKYLWEMPYFNNAVRYVRDQRDF